MSITVEIESEFLPKRKDAHDLYTPILYKYNSDGNKANLRHARHLDVVKTWKDLDYCQAEELYFWETATKAALESHLEEQLVELFVAAERDLDELPALTTLYRMRNFVNKLGQRRLEFPLSALTVFMSNFHSVYGSHFRWLMNIPDSDTVLGNYLRTFDFFRQDDLGRCIINVDLTAAVLDDGRVWSDDTQSTHSLRVTGTCRDQPHQLSFAVESLAVARPWFKEPVLDLDVPVFNTCVTVHDDSPSSPRFCVTVNKYFPGNVRLERTIRLDLPRHHDRFMLNSAALRVPSSISIGNEVKKDAKARRLYRIPAITSKKRPLRAISSSSARVQGTATSAFERAAKQKHRKLHEAHTERYRENIRRPAAPLDPRSPEPQDSENLPRYRHSVDDDASRARSSIYTGVETAKPLHEKNSSSISSMSSHSVMRTTRAPPWISNLVSAVPRGTPRSRYNAHREEHPTAPADLAPSTTQVSIATLQHKQIPPLYDSHRSRRFFPAAEFGSYNGSQEVLPVGSENGRFSDDMFDLHDYIAQLDNFPPVPMGNHSMNQAPCRADSPDLKQAIIERNYHEFLHRSPARMSRLEQEEACCIEEAFLEANDSASDSESSFSNISLHYDIHSGAKKARISPETAYKPSRMSWEGKSKTQRSASPFSSPLQSKHKTSISPSHPSYLRCKPLQDASDIRMNGVSRGQRYHVSPTLRKGRLLGRDDAALREEEDDRSEVEDRELATSGLSVFDLSRQPQDHGDYDDALEPEWYD